MKTIEAAGGNITYQAILNSLYKNVNTIQLISSVDWAKFLQVSSDGIQLPGMFAKLSLECALDLVKYFQPLVSANFSNPSTIGTIMQTPAVKSMLFRFYIFLFSLILLQNFQWFLDLTISYCSWQIMPISFYFTFRTFLHIFCHNGLL